jgi:hypothetical protein
VSEPLVTWSAEHEADYQRRLLAAYRLVYRAHEIAPRGEVRECLHHTLGITRHAMSDRTRMLASQWERALLKKEARS